MINACLSSWDSVEKALDCHVPGTRPVTWSTISLLGYGGELESKWLEVATLAFFVYTGSFLISLAKLLTQYGGIKMQKFNIVVTGACGKVGKEMVKGILDTKDMKIAGAVDVSNIGLDIGEIVGCKSLGVTITNDLPALIKDLSAKAQTIVVDFTFKDAARINVPLALKNGAHVVMGTTGLTSDELTSFADLAEKNNLGIFVAPNFSLGAVLMMKAARDISRYMKQAEIIEYHNDKKVDSPSGTAIATAHGMKENASSCGCIGNEKENSARGAEYDGIRIHSVRLKSLVAHQEVLFSGCGELLTIRHDSFSRESFVPGVLMAIRKVTSWKGIRIGLETIMD